MLGCCVQQVYGEVWPLCSQRESGEHKSCWRASGLRQPATFALPLTRGRKVSENETLDPLVSRASGTRVGGAGRYPRADDRCRDHMTDLDLAASCALIRAGNTQKEIRMMFVRSPHCNDGCNENEGHLLAVFNFRDGSRKEQRCFDDDLRACPNCGMISRPHLGMSRPCPASTSGAHRHN